MPSIAKPSIAKPSRATPHRAIRAEVYQELGQVFQALGMPNARVLLFCRTSRNRAGNTALEVMWPSLWGPETDEPIQVPLLVKKLNEQAVTNKLINQLISIRVVKRRYCGLSN